jgi:hypothetical protein
MVKSKKKTYKKNLIRKKKYSRKKINRIQKGGNLRENVDIIKYNYNILEFIESVLTGKNKKKERVFYFDDNPPHHKDKLSFNLPTDTIFKNSQKFFDKNSYKNSKLQEKVSNILSIVEIEIKKNIEIKTNVNTDFNTSMLDFKDFINISNTEKKINIITDKYQSIKDIPLNILYYFLINLINTLNISIVGNEKAITNMASVKKYYNDLYIYNTSFIPEDIYPKPDETQKDSKEPDIQAKLYNPFTNTTLGDKYKIDVQNYERQTQNNIINKNIYDAKINTAVTNINNFKESYLKRLFDQAINEAKYKENDDLINQRKNFDAFDIEDETYKHEQYTATEIEDAKDNFKKINIIKQIQVNFNFIGYLPQKDNPIKIIYYPIKDRINFDNTIENVYTDQNLGKFMNPKVHTEISPKFTALITNYYKIIHDFYIDWKNLPPKENNWKKQIDKLDAKYRPILSANDINSIKTEVATNLRESLQELNALVNDNFTAINKTIREIYILKNMKTFQIITYIPDKDNPIDIKLNINTIDFNRTVDDCFNDLSKILDPNIHPTISHKFNKIIAEYLDVLNNFNTKYKNTIFNTQLELLDKDNSSIVTNIIDIKKIYTDIATEYTEAIAELTQKINENKTSSSPTQKYRNICELLS